LNDGLTLVHIPHTICLVVDQIHDIEIIYNAVLPLFIHFDHFPSTDGPRDHYHLKMARKPVLWGIYGYTLILLIAKNINRAFAVTTGMRSFGDRNLQKPTA
jgi:hypothetical protein